MSVIISENGRFTQTVNGEKTVDIGWKKNKDTDEYDCIDYLQADNDKKKLTEDEVVEKKEERNDANIQELVDMCIKKDRLVVKSRDIAISMVKELNKIIPKVYCMDLSNIKKALTSCIKSCHNYKEAHYMEVSNGGYRVYSPICCNNWRNVIK